MNIRKGNKYYRYINDKLKIIRINRLKGMEYSVVDEATGDFEKITEKQLIEDYVLLRPDAFITFSIVLLDNGVKDVIVSLHRKTDLQYHSNTPYCVCRQNIADVFTNQVMSHREDQTYAGLSVSIDTCPAEIPFNSTLACNGIEYMDMISVYTDDSLSKMLSFINHKKFDSVLGHLANITSMNPSIFGYCNSIQQLLQENNFMYDFYRGFDIHMTPFALSDGFEGILGGAALEYMAKLVGKPLKVAYVTPLTKEVKLDEIKGEFVKIVDTDGRFFVVGYDVDEDADYKKYSKMNRPDMLSMAKGDYYRG